MVERMYRMSKDRVEEMAPGTCIEEWLSIVSPRAKRHFRATHQEIVQPFSEILVQEIINAGDKHEDLERGIVCLRRALVTLQKDAYPTQWALAHLYLGIAYPLRLVGARFVNQEQAIEHCNASLSVFTRAGFACQWATLQNSLGEIYRNRSTGTRQENLQQAIQYCQNALQVRTHETFPLEWALTQATLGAVYCELGLSTSEPQRICEQALEHYRGAMQILTEEKFPAQWAIIQQSLSAIYFMRISGNKVENIQEAIARGQSALRILTRRTYPFEWARAHTHLGEAYRQATLYGTLQELYSGRSVMQEQAIRHLEAALQIYTQQDYPLEWARAQRFQGMVYRERVQGKRYANLAQARDCFEQANLSMHF
jgi:tetratricopeptide (TPR) repeat protein